jgi:uncharacterized protein (TIGR03437 family)
MLALCGTLTAQTINSGGVVNAASQAPPGLPDAAIAQGSVFLINGTNLGADAQAGSPLDVTLNGTSVQVTVGGTALAAPIVATSATQVTAIMPSGIPTGSGTVTVTYNGTTSPAAPVVVAATAFGIYTLANNGLGPAQAIDANSNPISVVNPAQPGATVTVSGTGLGASSTDDVSAPPMNDLSSSLSITIYVGVEAVTAQYAGRAGTTPGQDQLVFTVPADAIVGCNVPLAVMVNNSPSNFASLAIANGATCSDANGLTSDQANQLQQILASGGTVNIASVGISRSVQNLGISLPPGITLPPGVPLPSNNTTTDSGSASFFQFTGIQLAGASSFQVASIGGCFVFAGSLNGLSAGQATGLDAGPSISISGTKGTKQMNPVQGVAGAYEAQLGSSVNGGTLYLDPGTFNISGPGGAAAGAFQVALTMPPALSWTSPPSTVTRANGVTVNWTGGAAGTYVTITGISSGAAPAGGGAGPAGVFACIAPVEAGTFTVPPIVTLSLPASASSSGPISIPSGFMGLQNTTAPVSFTVPGIDIASATASSSVMQGVSFQ